MNEEIRACRVCTPRMDGSVKPAYKGVYQRSYDSGRSWHFCKFDGSNWYVGSGAYSMAAREHAISQMQTLPWRGMRVDPYNRRPGLEAIVIRLQSQKPYAPAERIRDLAKRDWDRIYGRPAREMTQRAEAAAEFFPKSQPLGYPRVTNYEEPSK